MWSSAETKFRLGTVVTLQLTRTRQIRGFVAVSATYYTLHVADALSLANTKVSSKRERNMKMTRVTRTEKPIRLKKVKIKLGVRDRGL